MKMFPSVMIAVWSLAGMLAVDSVQAQPPPQVVVKKMDRDGDGRISADEWLKPPQVFKRIDADGDGYVTTEEIQAFRDGGGGPGMRKGMGGGPRGPGGPAATPASPVASGPVEAKDGWIDVHFHLIGNIGDTAGFEQAAQRAIAVMDDAGIGTIITMPPPRPRNNFDVESYERIKDKYKARIAYLGGGGTLNLLIQAAKDRATISDAQRSEFRAAAEKIIASGAKGFGEINVHHVSLEDYHGYQYVPADHPLLLELADIAAKHGVPIDIHFDPVPKDTRTPSHLTSSKNPQRFQENITAFERLLAHNRDAKIVWAHAGSDPVGWYTPKLVSKLLEKHPNLYCSIRPANRPDTEPAWNRRDGVNYSWIRVFKKYSNRFVLGTDSFVVADNYSGPQAARVFAGRTKIQRTGVNEILPALGDEARRKISSENAKRIYGL